MKKPEIARLPITLKTTLTHYDYRSAAVFNVFMRKWFTLIFVVVGLVSSVVLLYLHFTGTYEVSQSAFYASIVIPCMVLLMLLLSQMAKKQFISADRIPLGEERTYVISESKLVVRAQSDKQREYYIKNFSNVYESKSFFLVFPSVERALIIPKRDMGKDESLALRRLFSSTLMKKFSRRCDPNY